MFEEIIDLKINHFKQLINSDNDAITLKELENKNFPKSIIQFLKSEIEMQLFKININLESNTFFDYKTPEVKKIKSEFYTTLKANAMFPKKSLVSLIERAIKLEFNYFCRPNFTLKQFIFGRELTKSFSEFKVKISYFAAYSDFLKKVFDKVSIQNRRAEQDLISFAEFERVLNEVDDEYISEMSINHFVDQLSEFYNFFGSSARIPLEALSVYFDDKKLDDFNLKLENLNLNHYVKSISKSELTALILGEEVSLDKDADDDFQINFDFDSSNDNRTLENSLESNFDEQESDVETETPAENYDFNDLADDYDSDAKNFGDIMNDLKTKLMINEVVIEDSLEPEMSEDSSSFKGKLYSFYQNVNKMTSN